MLHKLVKIEKEGLLSSWFFGAIPKSMTSVEKKTTGQYVFKYKCKNYLQIFNKLNPNNIRSILHLDKMARIQGICTLKINQCVLPY